MDLMDRILFAAVIMFLAWLSAMYHRRRGYFFWRTFILACMGLGGLAMLFYTLFIA